MKSFSAYPLLFRPAYKDYIWGGNRLNTKYNRNSGYDVTAESWEVSSRQDGMSIIANGEYSGMQFGEIAAEFSNELTGARYAGRPFPLLIKLIDAKERLSVQVHPDNRTASRTGGDAKTEAWYVIDAEENSQIFAGLKKGTSRQHFEAAVKTGDFEPVMNSYKASPGTLFFIPGGRTHAIGDGCFILEVQQNSNTTYRVFDWNRVGNDGKPRELHVKKALEAINWNDNFSVFPSVIQTHICNQPAEQLCHNHFFKISRMAVSQAVDLNFKQNDSFVVLFTEKGSIEIKYKDNTFKVPNMSSCLIPAAMDGFQIIPDGDTRLILIEA